MADRTTLADYLTSKGQPVPETVECPVCHKSYPPFAVVVVNDLPSIHGDFACGHCIEDSIRQQVTTSSALSWADVRSFRGLLLSRSDWTQTMDVADSVRSSWAPVRGQLRDITTAYSSAAAAYIALKQIEKDKFST